MKSFKLWNNIIGWVFFFIAFVVYTLTAEQTTSWWDCGERILAAYKLQVMHPPGAPFYMIVGRIFSLFAPNPDLVAFSVNLLSVFSASFAVLFIFWITTHFARKLVMQDGEEFTKPNLWVIFGAGAIGALSCTFLDSLWFIAVESEVYAFSTFFMTLVFWSMVRWYNHEDRVYADRWLLFIALMIGLSIGVHLMSILVVPAIAMMYYIKYYKTNLRGIITAFIIGTFVLAFIFTGIVSNLLTLVRPFELLTVNTFGWFIGSGLVVFMIPLMGLLIYGVYYGIKNNKREVQIVSLCMMLLLVGFSNYFAISIRANANPPINMNKPGDVFSMYSYLNREQYGDRPLVYGPHFASFPEDVIEGSKRWFKVGDRYEHIGNRISYEFPAEDKMIFPRLGHWQEERHDRAYRAHLNLGANENPSLNDNFKYFFNYQLGYMYFRYFMWNFSGRQNDIQGTFQNNHGNWITGIRFIDESKIGPLDKYPDHYKNNKGYTKFYALPFLLGFLGLVFQFRQNRKYFYVILGMFLFTGAISIIYFNQPPVEPRERDYSTVGSFITYSIWLGLGVVAIAHILKNYVSKLLASQLAIVIALIAPVLMGVNGWDNHDRSKRTVVKDFATNYLESLAPNAVIFTQGDNDTYPLWNVQEVNGVRPDVRIVNLSLLGVDWYIDQLNYYINEAPPLKLSFEREQYLSNRRDVVRFTENPALGLDQSRYYNIKEIMRFIANDEPRTRIPDRGRGGNMVDYLPVRRLSIPVDRQEILDLGIVSSNFEDEIIDEIRWELPKTTLLKNDLMTLDIIANNLWERPIYFAVSVSPDTYLGLENYFQLEGMAYRLVPVETRAGQHQAGRVATDIMYDNVVNKFAYGNAQDGDVYLDETTLRMVMNIRSNLARLAEALVNEGEKEKATEVLDLSLRQFPKENAPYNMFMLRYPEIYYRADEIEKARSLTRDLATMFEQEFYYYSAPENRSPAKSRNAQQAGAVIQELLRISSLYNDEEMSDELTQKFSQMQNVMR
ncbi:MAG: DUF2723 domain-containing protein [Chitinophagaceae bacterium]|nr:MAG: DUF2723 domain-containing protein [Chitinophagaceae bacterium]